MDDLFSLSRQSWSLLWEQTIEGIVYYASLSKTSLESAIVYKVNLDQGMSHIMRYYKDLSKGTYVEHRFVGSSYVESLSVYNGLVVYCVEAGFKSFHTLAQIEVTLDDKTEILWYELYEGQLNSRKEYAFNEATGLKLVDINGTVYLLRSTVTVDRSYKSGLVSLDLLEFSEDQFKKIGTLYNISLNDFSIQFDDPDVVRNNPRIRLSDENILFVGHYGSILMCIKTSYFKRRSEYFMAHYITSALEASFDKIDVSKDGKLVVIVFCI